MAVTAIPACRWGWLAPTLVLALGLLAHSVSGEPTRKLASQPPAPLPKPAHVKTQEVPPPPPLSAHTKRLSRCRDECRQAAQQVELCLRSTQPWRALQEPGGLLRCLGASPAVQRVAQRACAWIREFSHLTPLAGLTNAGHLRHNESVLWKVLHQRTMQAPARQPPSRQQQQQQRSPPHQQQHPSPCITPLTSAVTLASASLARTFALTTPTLTTAALTIAPCARDAAAPTAVSAAPCARDAAAPTHSSARSHGCTPTSHPDPSPPGHHRAYRHAR